MLSLVNGDFEKLQEIKIQLALCICRFSIYEFNQPQLENIQEKKNLSKFQNQNLNLPCVKTTLHLIHANEVMCRHSLL